MSVDRYGLPYLLCPCWRHRLQWRLVRASVAAAFAGYRLVARVLLACSEVVA